ncbi:MAG TPA: 16S rRNA (cytosine(1402)-N(4))-methyltransferase, partial [Chloroflexota bacterium]|nr:16S rRNA (cytosine(1402)-N(4))-methyltransferase [Chloroflexota bacterium]
MTSHDHEPVLVGEVLSFLNLQPNTDFVDATVGMAGHARAILNMTAPNGRLLGIDADRQAIDSARVSLLAFAGRVTLVRGYFDTLETAARGHGFDTVDGVLFDLGVSSPQIDV